MNYWEECVSSALEEAGLTATNEQLKIMADVVSGGHENYGMAFGHDCIPNPLMTEIDKLKRQLKIEKDKTVCKTCKGTGSIHGYWLDRESISQCWDCHGEGKR